MTADITVSETNEKLMQFIGQQESRFVELNKGGLNALNFKKEAEFAKQLLLKNDYTLGVARGNPDSLQAAISNVAAIGISLNPALAFAYLVPRKNAICLDISYRGMIKLATDTGIIKAMKAELVHKNDMFEYHGFHKEPIFHANPFGDRGDLVGVYAMAIMTDGTVLVETMTIDAVNAIRDDSEAYKSAKQKGGWTLENNVWVKFYTEMVKKTVIKRCYKTLPTSGKVEILGKAIEVLNEHEGIDFQQTERLAELHYTEEELAEYQRCVDTDDQFNLFALVRSLGIEAQGQLDTLCVPKAEKGMIGKAKKEWAQKRADAELQVENSIVIIGEAADAGDDVAVQEILDDCSQWTVDYIAERLTQEQRIFVNSIRTKAA